MKYSIVPVPKPRQTRADKWKKRPPVMRYRAFANHVKLLGINVEPCGNEVIFYMPMSKSWSKKKKALFNNEPHQNKPDIDNLLKALLDAIYDDDSNIWSIKASKVWSYEGAIEIK